MHVRCDYKDDTNGEDLQFFHFLYGGLTKGILIMSSNSHVLLRSFLTCYVDTCSPQVKAEAFNIMSLPLVILQTTSDSCTQLNNPTGIWI